MIPRDESKDPGARFYLRATLMDMTLPALIPLCDAFAERSAKKQQAFEKLLELHPELHGTDTSRHEDLMSAVNVSIADAILLVADNFTKQYVNALFGDLGQSRKKYGALVRGTDVPFGAAFYAGANAARHFIEYRTEDPHKATKKILDRLNLQYNGLIGLKILQMNRSVTSEDLRADLHHFCEFADEALLSMT